MNYCDLLERMMNRDTDAFLEMTDRYGWSLYSEIRKKYSNKADADRIYDETMQQFYRCLQNPAYDDPVEALLYAFADRVSAQKQVPDGLFTPKTSMDNLQPPSVSMPNIQIEQESVIVKPKSRLGFRLALFLLVLGFLSVIWIGVGLMMEAGILPYYDLGYTWLADLVSQWL